MPAGDKWVDRNAGPVVRPYALTGGRTEPVSGQALDLITVVVAAGRGDPQADAIGLSPEQRRILGLCQRPTTIADVASATTLPVGVVRVLIADLMLQGRLIIIAQRPAGEQPSVQLLKEVLHGLRTL
jgi:hypothetical protein